MCTAINFVNRKQEGVFGRTMDFHVALDAHFTAFSKGASWETMEGKRITDRYGVGGICHQAQGLRLLLDGVNEKGVGGGALYFKGYAAFPQASQQSNKAQIPALDFLHYALGSCGSLDELREHLDDIELVELQDERVGASAPLHWIFADLSGRSIVVEQTRLGRNIYENPVGVLTNSPEFPWQLTNLRNYIQAMPEQVNQADWNGFFMEPFGQACGTSALPGGYTPPARFVRTVFQKLHMVQPGEMQEAVIAGFHILEGVTLPNGVVKTSGGTFDYTQYTSMTDLSNQVYYFKTYENPQMIQVDLKSVWASGKKETQDLGSICVPVCYGTIGS